MTAEPSEQLKAEVRRKLAAANKIEAVKQLREATSMGLAEAKKAVEGIEAGHLPISGGAKAMPSGLDESRIKAMIERDETMAAIKLYRQTLGVDLKAAEEAVDALTAQLRATAGAHRARTVERFAGIRARGIAILVLVLAVVAFAWLLWS